jgi:hypothetical protein
MMRLPRGFGWIRGVLPKTGQFAGVLAYFLHDPEVAALVEKAPQAGRILRALCRLLGVNVPAFLRRGAQYTTEAGAQPSPAAIDATPSSRRSLSREEEATGADGAVAPPSPQPTGSSPVAEPHSPIKAEGEKADTAALPWFGAAGADGGMASPPPQRPLSWLELDAAAMRERVARWVAKHADAPSTLLPLGLSPSLELPGTGPIRSDAKNRG